MFQSISTSDGNGPTYFADLFIVNCVDDHNMDGDGVEVMHCFQIKKNNAGREVRRKLTVVRRWLSIQPIKESKLILYCQ